MISKRNAKAVSAALLMMGTFAAFSQEIPSLKNTFKNDFGIGTALNNGQIEERDPKMTEMIVRQFNRATPENVMKSALIHPKWDTYDFVVPDKLIEFGKKHNIKINGHTLIWHSQLPSFIRGIHSKDSIQTFFTNHIQTVAGRYKDNIFSWDVVNEALNEDGTLRKTVFLDYLGEGYLA